MLRSAVYLLVLVAFLAGSATFAVAEKRVALVIGNSAYEHAPELKNPKNDAAAMSAVLEELGFDVVTGTDLSHASFAQTVNTFRKKLQGADVGLFFYAGHGLQVHGRNYLAPVDAELENETSLDFEAIPLHVVLRLMERSTKTNLVFLDACRDNPLARNLARSMGTRSTAIGRGLAREETGLGTMISFATQPGNVALDGEGNNSPFASGMLKHIETPGLDVALVMRRVREDVIKATSGSQVPWSNSSLTGSFVFKEKPKKAPKPQEQSDRKTPPSRPVVDKLAVELAFWQAAKDANTPQSYKAYLAKYPQGNFAPLASIHLNEQATAEAAAAKRRTELERAKKKQIDAEKAKQAAEAKQRQQELAELQRNQAEEQKRLAQERDELEKRLKAMEERAKKLAEEKELGEQQLASLQSQQPSVPAVAPSTPELDPRTMTMVLQNELKRVGCDPGKVDGKWGRKGKGALSKFNKYASLKLPTNIPSMEAIAAVKEKTNRVCPQKTISSIPKPKAQSSNKSKKSIVKSNTKKKRSKVNSDKIGPGKLWRNMKEYCADQLNPMNCANGLPPL